ECKIASEHDRFCSGVREVGDDPGTETNQTVNLIVETPCQAPENSLRIESPGAVSPASENNLLLVGNAVVVDILVVNQIRNRAHEDAAAIAKDRRRPAQALCKNRVL